MLVLQVGGEVTLRALPQSRLHLRCKARQWTRVGGGRGEGSKLGLQKMMACPSPLWSPTLCDVSRFDSSSVSATLVRAMLSTAHVRVVARW